MFTMHGRLTVTRWPSNFQWLPTPRVRGDTGSSGQTGLSYLMQSLTGNVG